MIQRSDDGGETWTKVNGQIPNQDVHNVLVVAGPPKAVFTVVKGGLSVDVGVRAFMPASRSGARDQRPRLASRRDRRAIAETPARRGPIGGPDERPARRAVDKHGVVPGNWRERAIINPPEGAILAVGSVLEKPVVEDGQLRVGRRMKMTISCDHRVMDGAMGARFLQDVKRLLEEPLRLLV